MERKQNNLKMIIVVGGVIILILLIIRLLPLIPGEKEKLVEKFAKEYNIDKTNIKIKEDNTGIRLFNLGDVHEDGILVEYDSKEYRIWFNSNNFNCEYKNTLNGEDLDYFTPCEEAIKKVK